MIEIKKLYYTIGQVAKIIGVATSTLRFYDKQFGQLYFRKSRNRRQYTKQNIKNIQAIYRLLKENRRTIAEVQELLRVEIVIKNNLTVL